MGDFAQNLADLVEFFGRLEARRQLDLAVEVEEAGAGRDRIGDRLRPEASGQDPADAGVCLLVCGETFPVGALSGAAKGARLMRVLEEGAREREQLGGESRALG